MRLVEVLKLGRHTWKLIGVFLLLALSTIILACTPSHPQSTFDTLGPVAETQANLFYWIFWSGLVVLLAVGGVLAYIVIKYRRRLNDKDPEQIHGHTRLEIAWTILPVIIVVFIAVPTIFAIFETSNSPHSPEDGGVVIDAIGHQWWFEFKYPNHDVITANEIHIPVGQPININLKSVDVIHSFWIPKLAGKVDMIPNNNNTMWIQADEPGIYIGTCAEFCGISHAHMGFRVIAEPRDEFDAWLIQQAEPSVTSVDPLAIEGEELFMSTKAGCRGCHTIGGTKARGVTGPDLTHFASRTTFAGSILENTQSNLRAWLEDPDHIKPGNIMAKDGVVFNDPDRALNESQVSALMAYLRVLE